MKERVLEASREKTYFGISTNEEAFTWPVVTVCPITTLLMSTKIDSTEISMNEIQLAKKRYSAMISDIEVKRYNLMNESFLLENGLSFDEIWKFQIYTINLNFQPEVCLLLNLATLQKKVKINFSGLFIDIKKPDQDTNYFVELSEPFEESYETNPGENSYDKVR